MDRKTNRFYLSRKNIAALAEKDGYDADTACVVYANQQNWNGARMERELKEFREEMRRAQLAKKGTLYDLFHD